MKPQIQKHHTRIREALKQLEAFINDLHQSTDPNPHRYGFSSFFRSGEFGELALNDQQAEAYFSVLDSLAPDEGTPPPRSRAEIDRALNRCILSAVTPMTKSDVGFEERTKQSITELKDALTSQLKEWEIWRFIERMAAPQQGFQFGKVLFCNHSHESAKAKSAKMLRTIERNRRLGSSPAFRNAWPATIEQHTLCRITLNAADKDAALQLSEFELETTLNALNFFASLFYPSDRWPTLASRPDSSPRHELRFYFDQTSKEWGCQTIFPPYREVFDPKIVSEDGTVEKAFNKVSKLLSSSTGGLDDRFLSAIKWAGKGSVSEKRENAFIFYSIALEALLLGQQHHEQLAYRLRLRAAHLLGRNNLARSKIRDQVNHLYSLRSKIVHSGRTELSQADLNELRIIAQSCIIRLLSDQLFDECSNEEDIENWFEERIVSGPESGDTEKTKPS